MSANQWRYIGKQSFTEGLANALDAIHTLGTKTTYYDGSTRTPGSGVAATYTKVQESGVTVAVHATPATTSQGLKYIWAGGHAASSGTTASPDSWSGTRLFASISLDSGAYAGYEQALPFGSGSRFFGYWRAGLSSETSQPSTHVYLYECALAVAYVFSNTSETDTHGGMLGRMFEAVSSHSSDSEADGNIYGVFTSGPDDFADMYTATTSSGTNDVSFFFHNPTNANPHTGIFTPGQAVIMACHANKSGFSSQVNNNVARSGKIVVQDKTIQINQYSNPEAFLGVASGYSLFQPTTHGSVVVDTSAGKDIGYVIAESKTDSAAECVILLRNE